MPLLHPKKKKYRKEQRGRRKGVASRGANVSFGDWGIQALEPAWITSEQIESCRMVLTRELGKGSKVWIRIFPDKPVTKTAAETRMGKGKGEPEGWVAVVLPGRVMFEMAGISKQKAERVHKLVSYKLPIRTRPKRAMRLGGEEVSRGERRTS